MTLVQKQVRLDQKLIVIELSRSLQSGGSSWQELLTLRTGQ
jgi:hypothetical protein